MTIESIFFIGWVIQTSEWDPQTRSPSWLLFPTLRNFFWAQSTSLLNNLIIYCFNWFNLSPTSVTEEISCGLGLWAGLEKKVQKHIRIIIFTITNAKVRHPNKLEFWYWSSMIMVLTTIKQTLLFAHWWVHYIITVLNFSEVQISLPIKSLFCDFFFLSHQQI